MIPLALLLFPLFEIATTVGVIQRLGFGNAFFLWLFATILGVGLFRATSGRLSYGVAQALRRGESPGIAAVKGALIGLAGLLFLVPGFLSDLLGLFVLLPFVRGYIARRLLAKIPSADGAKARYEPTDVSPSGSEASRMVIDVESLSEETNKH